MGVDTRMVRYVAARAVAYGVRAIAVMVFMPAMTQAQSGIAPGCAATTGPLISAADACQKVVDIFRVMSPQVGIALMGGNPMPGESGTLGGGGKNSFSIRATVVDGFVPSNEFTLATDGSVLSTNLGADRVPIPMPSADVAVGVYRGKPVGLTNIGGIDLLLGVTYVPDVNKGVLALDASGSGFSASYGVRVGVFQESALVPGVSVSYRKRSLPTTSILYRTIRDTLKVDGASVSTQSFRLVAGKHYRFVGIAGGFGKDKIDAKSLFNAIINRPPLPRLAVQIPATRQKLSRNNAFVNLSVGLPRAQLVGEMGWSSAGDAVQTVNTFGDHVASEKYRYYSLGLSFRPY